MRGFPKMLQTKEDYYNVIQMANRRELSREQAAKVLDNLIATRNSNYLKETSMGKDPKDQTPDDFEPRVDTSSEMEKLGFTETEINKLKGGL